MIKRSMIRNTEQLQKYTNLTPKPLKYMKENLTELKVVDHSTTVKHGNVSLSVITRHEVNKAI